MLPHGHARMPSPQHRRHARPRRRRGRGRARRAAAAGGPGGRAGVAAAVHAARLDVPAGGRAGLRCRRAPRPPAAPARPPRAARARALAPQRAPGARRAGHPETRGRVLARLHAGGTSSSPQRMQCSVAYNPAASVIECSGACGRQDEPGARGGRAGGPGAGGAGAVGRHRHGRLAGRLRAAGAAAPRAGRPRLPCQT